MLRMFAATIPPDLQSVILDALPVIISLIVIEGLLSVDNALAIAAMASHLPGRQKYWALRVGILGAYVFRGLALLLAQFIIANPWLKLLGAAYLIHLMARHFARHHLQGMAAAAEEGDFAAASLVQRGFWGTVVSIELMDLSLGVDNVVAAVALSDKLWVVCTGVFIGILALRFVAGRCIRLIEKFPVLEHTAFLLIGFVGVLLVVELAFHREIATLEKFSGIVAIIAFTIWYSRSERLRALVRPFNATLRLPVLGYERLLGGAFFLLLAPYRLFFRKSRIPEPVQEVEHALDILGETRTAKREPR